MLTSNPIIYENLGYLIQFTYLVEDSVTDDTKVEPWPCDLIAKIAPESRNHQGLG